MTFEHSEEMKKIAEKLIETEDDLLQIKVVNPKIAYVVSDQKKHSHGMIVFGDCEKVKPKMRKFMDYDYIITFYEKNIAYLDDSKLEILMKHELLHIDCDRDDNGKVIAKIRPHDVQEFRSIADEHGIDWWRSET